jgi:hypothetical protein
LCPPQERPLLHCRTGGLIRGEATLLFTIYILKPLIVWPGSKEVKAVERKVRVLPSGRVSSMELYMQHDNGKSVQMKEGETIVAVAGQTISGLSM